MGDKIGARPFFLVLLLMFLSASAPAENIPAFTKLLSLSGSLISTHSAADSVAGATYAKPFSGVFTGQVDLGILVTPAVYVGVAYEHWFAQRSLTANGSSSTDNLRYQAVGAEIGYYSVNPRVYYFVTGTAFYPVVARIESSSGILYQPSKTGLPSFRAKVGFGIRFNHYVGMLLSLGYRFAYLGNWGGQNLPYLPGGGALDFSGVQGSVGLSIGI